MRFERGMLHQFNGTGALKASNKNIRLQKRSRKNTRQGNEFTIQHTVIKGGYTVYKVKAMRRDSR